jgi:phosphoglycolate phosphatase
MNLLFDLDGTLTDPKEGITKSINHALAKFNLPLREPVYLERFIGPSLKDSFRVLLDTDDGETLAQAVVWFRERYFVKGWLENAVYPGIPDLLRACRSSGHRLYVATAKRQDIAERVLTHFQLAPYFTAIYGCDVDLTKAELLADIMQKHELMPASCRMIGDRRHDVAAGRANDVPTIGVLWGYGTTDELTAAGVDYLAETTDALQSLVRDQALKETCRI